MCSSCCCLPIFLLFFLFSFLFLLLSYHAVTPFLVVCCMLLSMTLSFLSWCFRVQSFHPSCANTQQFCCGNSHLSNSAAHNVYIPIPDHSHSCLLSLTLIGLGLGFCDHSHSHAQCPAPSPSPSPLPAVYQANTKFTVTDQVNVAVQFSAAVGTSGDGVLALPSCTSMNTKK